MVSFIKSCLLVAFIGAILVFAFLGFEWLSMIGRGSVPDDFFVGVELAYDSVEDCEQLIDRVKGYTNLFVIGATELSHNETKLNRICQYAYDSGLGFIPFMYPINQTLFNQSRWFDEARSRWGDRLLGVYAYDEWGGRQVDSGNYKLVTQAHDYADAARKYNESLSNIVRLYPDYMNTGRLKLISADYALYWFTYEAGYDMLLCEFGWNHSRSLNIALCRGAATVLDKEWGVIITWSKRVPPYIESGDELYYDMVLAYLSGAKYIVLFNYPKISEYGILEEEHFEALQRFWSYVQSNPRAEVDSLEPQRIGYVLPKDYGWAFRGTVDKVWGLWEDELSEQIGRDIDYLLHSHHLGLDIIYDDPKHYDFLQTYGKLIFWNGTVID